MARANELQFQKALVTVPIISAHFLFSAQDMSEYIFINVF